MRNKKKSYLYDLYDVVFASDDDVLAKDENKGSWLIFKGRAVRFWDINWKYDGIIKI